MPLALRNRITARTSQSVGLTIVGGMFKHSVNNVYNEESDCNGVSAYTRDVGNQPATPTVALQRWNRKTILT